MKDYEKKYLLDQINLLELTVLNNMESEFKYVAEMKKLLAKGKVKAPIYFEVGKAFGMTCKEVCEARKKHFPRDKKIISENEKIIMPILDGEIELNGDYGSHEIKDNSEDVDDGPPPDFGVVIDTPDEFVWIASPEEIENPADLHSTNYSID